MQNLTLSLENVADACKISHLPAKYYRYMQNVADACKIVPEHAK
jgi:hypothetical protein